MKATFRRILVATCAFIVTLTTASGQYLHGGMSYLLFPRAVGSAGMGGQGVALPGSDDAMTFNPARLVNASGISAGIFRFPVYMLTDDIAVTSVTGTYATDSAGFIGLDFVGQSYPPFVTSTSMSPGVTNEITPRDWSLSVSYAREMGDGFSGGIQACYARSTFGDARAINIFVSAGVIFVPVENPWGLSFGAALTNMGTTVEFNSYGAWPDPTPSELRLGAYGEPVREPFFALGLGCEFVKPIQWLKDGVGAQSSFEALFNGWKGFPRDCGFLSGLTFRWDRLPLGKGVDFFQEFSVGNMTWGPDAGLVNYYTQSVSIGLAARGFTLRAGYAANWHNVQYRTYWPYQRPWEMFSLQLSADPSTVGKVSRENAEQLRQIQVSGGASSSFRFGQYHEQSLGSGLMRSNNNGIRSTLRAAFYISDRAALVTSFGYERLTSHYGFTSPVIFSYYAMDIRTEIVTLSAEYRYHPLDEFHPWYMQGGAGIAHMNYLGETSPKYDYRSTLNVGTGALIPIVGPLSVEPFADMMLLFERGGSALPHLIVEPQVDLGLTVAYMFR